MIGLRALIGKLSATTRAALERATQRALGLGHYAVELDHLLIELADDPGSDLAVALDRYAIDAAGLVGELGRGLMRFETGNIETAGLAVPLATAIETGWMIASIDLDAGAISSACILRAVIEDVRLRDAMIAVAPMLAQLPRQRLAEDLPGIVARGFESRRAAAATIIEHGAADGGGGPPPALAAYVTDLTAEALAGRLDPVIGREAEIDQVIETLMRRRQNNPILTGDAGVGKTAIVEGLAQRVAAGQVPDALAGVAILALDLGRLQAGASVQGEFEARLRTVIEGIEGAPHATILFIDEAHMLIGAGGAAGQGDAANLLKPALARGTLRTIAATTWSEYKRYFEKDAALARRFQPIKVEPPSVETTVVILRHLATTLERFHAVRITEDALADAARLSQRYIADRQLPDKAINVLDTACARVAIAQSAPPRALDAAELRCTHLDAEIARLDAGASFGEDYEERFEQLGVERAAAEAARDALANRWEQERYTVARIRELETSSGERAATGEALRGLYLELAELQRGAPLVPVAVDRHAVADVVSAWSGVPIGAILGSANTSGAELRAMMAGRIVGQDHAIDTIVRRVQTFQADLADPDKPTGVFLLCGPSGVGKTETALALADLLFGGARSLITVNMSEYQEAHSVSGLKGAPPGYVGHGKGGVLTEAVRRQPYSVVLLDEVEKAHPDVLELFYQVFDRGMLEDSEGVAVDFTHTLILLTSNIGSELFGDPLALADHDAAALVRLLKPELARHFAPAFLARLVVVPYRPLTSAELEAVVRLKLARVGQRFAGSRRGILSYDEDTVAAIATRAIAAGGGARSVDAIVTHQLLPALSEHLLDSLAEPGTARDAAVCVGRDGRLKVEIAR